jgi:DNA anti-recombination protein RmuC
MGWVILIIALILIFLAIKYAMQYWSVTFALGVIGFVAYLISEHLKMEKLRRATEASRENALKAEQLARKNALEAEQQTRKRALEAEQEQCRTRMIRVGEESLDLFECMPGYLKSAERSLDQAEVDFAEGVFAPFWDSIEKAATALGRFDEGVYKIKANSYAYTALIPIYRDAPPRFPLSSRSVSKLSVATATTERMNAIVRTAQRSFQFATIYEQRKTNQILVAGFTNLAQALDQIAWQIRTSISDLARAVDVMSSTLNESLMSIDSRIDGMSSEMNESLSAIQSQIDFAAETVGKRHLKLLDEVSEGAARERKALEMLDNIQRGRKPSF